MQSSSARRAVARRLRDAVLRAAREGQRTADQLDARPVPALGRRAREGSTRPGQDRASGSVILFGIPTSKDAKGTGGYAKNGIVQQAVAPSRTRPRTCVVITDVCLCEYTDHGHCGIVERRRGRQRRDAASCWRRSPSSQPRPAPTSSRPVGHDGRHCRRDPRGARRRRLRTTPILSYAAKYATAFYGPFREAAESAAPVRRPARLPDGPGERARGDARDRRSIIEEGADIIMVKPALPTWTSSARAKREFDLPDGGVQRQRRVRDDQGGRPRAAGSTRRRSILEALTSIKRAGSDFILTYFARGAAAWMT